MSPNDIQLDFSVFAMPEMRPEVNWNLSYDQLVEEAQLAEKLGFNEYWIGEHHSGAHETVPMPEMQLARIAEVTDRIKLMPATFNLSYDINDPFGVATRLAFLDQISHGRVNIGYGAGGQPDDMEMFNAMDDQMKDRMWESIDVIETYLEAEEPTDYDGEFYQYEGRVIQVPPYQKELKTSLAGFTNESTYYNAAKDGHRPLSINFIPLETPNNPEAVSLIDMAEAIDEGAKAAGRDPLEVRQEWCIVRDVYIAESKEQAFEDIREGVHDFYEYVFNLGLVPYVKSDEEQEREDLTVEWLAENVPFLIGTPEDIIKQIKALHERVGPFGHLVLTSHDWEVPQHKWNQSLELFAKEVMPAFKSRLGPREFSKNQVTSVENPVPGSDVFKLDASDDSRNF